MTQVLVCGAAIVTVSMGIRHGFGLWLQPITMDRGWTRETFALALAVQNLAWGLAGPFAGMLADRFGALRVLVAGGLLTAWRRSADGCCTGRARGRTRRRRSPSWAMPASRSNRRAGRWR